MKKQGILNQFSKEFCSNNKCKTWKDTIRYHNIKDSVKRSVEELVDFIILKHKKEVRLIVDNLAVDFMKEATKKGITDTDKLGRHKVVFTLSDIEKVITKAFKRSSLLSDSDKKVK